jgi:hypothetical protein
VKIVTRYTETIRGLVFCSFLALVLRKELQDRVERHGWSLEWADIIGDLDRLQEVEMSIQGKSYVVRTETKGTVGKVFHACGVALPPTLRQAEASEVRQDVSLRPCQTCNSIRNSNLQSAGVEDGPNRDWRRNRALQLQALGDRGRGGH